jgi:hypothetical protein
MSEDSPSAQPVNGPSWAAVLAGAIGCLTFGILVDLAEAVPRISSLLNFHNPVGDLSGKSIIAVIVWIVVWIGLSVKWKHRQITNPSAIIILSLVLILLALIAVFPPFFTKLG